MFPVNCYLLWDETNEAVVIDPGCFYEEEKQDLENFIQGNNLQVKQLLNTHTNLDLSLRHISEPTRRLYLTDAVLCFKIINDNNNIVKSV